MAEIELQEIRKVFGTGQAEVAAVDGVSLEIAAGELFFLLGPSGCGKTTLLRIIAGLTEATSGKVLLKGKDVTNLPIERRGTALVFQNYALWPHMSVGQNVRFGPRMQGASRTEQSQIAQAQLDRVQMGDLAGRKPNQLSGGQQQRVALARALAAGGDALLLDEPLSNLDAQLRLHMRSQIRQLVKETHLTAVYVTHDQVEALSTADRIAVMNAGKIVQVGTPAELYDRPASRFVAEFIGEANFIDGRLTQAGETVQIETPAGQLIIKDGPGIDCESPVTCCIRPERVSISPAREEIPQGRNTLDVTIESTTYLGQMRQYRVRLSSGQHWKVTVLADGATQLSKGSAARISFNPADLIVLNQSGR